MALEICNPAVDQWLVVNVFEQGESKEITDTLDN